MEHFDRKLAIQDFSRNVKLYKSITYINMQRTKSKEMFGCWKTNQSWPT